MEYPYLSLHLHPSTVYNNSRGLALEILATVIVIPGSALVSTNYVAPYCAQVALVNIFGKDGELQLLRVCLVY